MADNGVIGTLTLHCSKYHSTDKVMLPRGFKIRRVEFGKRKTEVLGSEQEEFVYEIVGEFTPAGEGEKPFDVFMYFKNHNPNIEIRV